MKRFTIIAAFGVIAGMLQAQQLPLNLRYDIARFYGDANDVYMEMYYTFDVSALRYRPEKGNVVGEAVVTSLIKRSANDSIVARQGWRIPFNVTDTTMLLQSRMYSDVFGYMLTPDLYRVYIAVSDYHNPSIKDSLSFLLDVKPIASATVALSDVQLATSIVPMERDSTNRFYKNSFEVKPNPSRLFGAHQPILFYYVEAYNLRTSSSPTYTTRAVVTNAVGKEVINHEKTKRRVNPSSVEVGKVNVASLRSGSYTFTYSIIDSADGSVVSTSERFNVFNPTLPNDTLVNPNSMNVDATEYATMSETEVDKEFEQSKYIASKSESEQWKKLSGVDAKRKALHEFWSKRDEDLLTPQNEKKLEYFKRVSDANIQYKTGFREGWKTDRGRVFIIYGAPDDVERHANETDTKPYEIWYYNSIQGGVQFIFGDRTGFSDYILLHSTHRNELRDENWRRQIQAN